MNTASQPGARVHLYGMCIVGLLVCAGSPPNIPTTDLGAEGMALPIANTMDAPDTFGPITTDASRKSRVPLLVTTSATPYPITFFHTHTKEVIGASELSSPDAIAHFLRCRATHDETNIDPRLVAVASSIAEDLGGDRIEIVSGYRSPKFNEGLRKKGRQVASKSKHMEGRALDFRVEGIDAASLSAALEEVHVGGIGTYRHSDFVHIDFGRNRRWSGT